MGTRTRYGSFWLGAFALWSHTSCAHCLECSGPNHRMIRPVTETPEFFKFACVLEQRTAECKHAARSALKSSATEVTGRIIRGLLRKDFKLSAHEVQARRVCAPPQEEHQCAPKVQQDPSKSRPRDPSEGQTHVK